MSAAMNPRFKAIDGGEAPILDIQLGRSPQWRLRIFGSADLTPPLVEVRAPGIFGDVLNLTVDQAEKIGAALIKAAAKAKREDV